MKKFHFSKTYFNKLEYDDKEANIRIIIKEIPSLEIFEEDYSLRVETQHEEDSTIHRKYAIEHHSKFDKPNYPHLQFKFHTEEIGQFRIRIDTNTPDEYKKAILGFIYKIKNVLEELEKFRKGITEEILVLDLVNGLEKEGEFLTIKMMEGIKKYKLEFDKKRGAVDKLKQLRKNPLLIDFMGKDNIKLVEESYKCQKFSTSF